MVKNSNKLLVLIFLISTFVLSVTTSIDISFIKNVEATTNTIQDFGNQSQDSSSSDSNKDSSDSTSSSNAEDSNSDNIDNSEKTDSSDNVQSETQPTSDNAQGKTIKNTLVNPTAYNYQINPEKKIVDIAKDPNQNVNVVVTDSFGNGVSNVRIEMRINGPLPDIPGHLALTDSSGKSVIPLEVNAPGSWTAEVKIDSSPTVGGPFTDTISWDAIKTNSNPATPPATNQPYSVKLAYDPVVLSNDPRQQIITTVKDLSGKAIKDVKLTIKLTNADGISKTFSRITDANGIDEFVTPVDKVGFWKAQVLVFDATGKVDYGKTYSWKVIP